MADIILIVVIAGALGLALRAEIRRRTGKSSSGCCGSCSGCSGCGTGSRSKSGKSDKLS